MAPIHYTITLTGQGEGDPAELREAFEQAVRAVRRAELPVGGQLMANVAGTRDPSGTLTPGEVIHYLADDVEPSWLDVDDDVEP